MSIRDFEELTTFSTILLSIGCRFIKTVDFGQRLPSQLFRGDAAPVAEPESPIPCRRYFVAASALVRAQPRAFQQFGQSLLEFTVGPYHVAVVFVDD